MLGRAAGTAALAGGHQPRLTAPAQPLVIPDHPQELQVFLCGKGAADAARSNSGQQVGVLDPKLAATACRGKRDFILFEPLDDAAGQGMPLVIVLPLGAPRTELGQAQVYLASSLARWLKEQKTDGSGRPYGECKDEDPTLRKHFTRAQINAILSFGEEAPSGSRR